MALYQFFKEKELRGQSLVLVTVFETAGSTYSKAGQHMIIDADGNFCGMLSGGCLEGDLVERARTVTESGEAQTATYDLGADDELWGLGVGCDGTMRVLLQPLSKENDYQPFAAIAEVLNGGTPALIATVIASELVTVEPGAAVVFREDESNSFGIDDDIVERITRETSFAGVAVTRNIEYRNGSCRVLVSKLSPAPALLIFGAGLDSEPLARFAAELGWRCTVVDHRPAYIEARNYPPHTQSLCCNTDELDTHVDLDAYDMAIVMSHHLVSDRSYLERLAHSRVGYVGLLGPPGRRDRLLDELGDLATNLRDRLRGPAGIVLGGRGPGPIALEIVAEMQQYLAERGQVGGSVDVGRSGFE